MAKAARKIWLKRLHKTPGVKPADKFFTLLLVPSHGNSRSVRFSRKLARAFAVTAVLFAVSLSYFIASYRANRAELAELMYMRDVAESQRVEIMALDDQCKSLSLRLKEAEVVEAQITNMLANEGLLSQESGMAAAVADFDRGRTILPSRGGESRQERVAPKDLGTLLLKTGSEADGLEKRLDEVSAGVARLLEDAVQTVAYFRARPNQWPVSGRISSPFGPRRHPITRRLETHEGTDIAAPYGDKILAPADGVVTFAGYKAGYGYCLVIEHDFGFETLYGHCSRLTVSLGDTIIRGDHIGNVGQSGVATGPHLHYEVHVKGKKVDPEKYLP